MNAVFNLKMEVTVGENLLTGVSVITLKYCMYYCINYFRIRTS